MKGEKNKTKQKIKLNNNKNFWQATKYESLERMREKERDRYIHVREKKKQDGVLWSRETIKKKIKK